VAGLELYGTARCPHTQEMREWLEWQRKDFVEYDVDKDTTARQRLHALSGGQRSVPVLVEDDKIIRIGWEGRTCVIEAD
jgi:glutaredoxin